MFQHYVRKFPWVVMRNARTGGNREIITNPKYPKGK